MDWKLNYKLYTTVKTLSTTKWVELVEKKEFAAAFLNLKDETFKVYVASFATSISQSSSNLIDIE